MASKKLRRSAEPPEEELKIDMSPMIDMVFLLLIFFIVASTVIIVKQDPKVDPPIAKHSKRAENGEGRIVVNIREDGTFRAEDFENVSLDDADAIEQYIKDRKEEEDAKGFKPVIHVRGDRKTSFKYVRTVIRAAAKAGVDNVIFSVYSFEKKKS